MTLDDFRRLGWRVSASYATLDIPDTTAHLAAWFDEEGLESVRLYVVDDQPLVMRMPATPQDVVAMVDMFGAVEKESPID